MAVAVALSVGRPCAWLALAERERGRCSADGSGTVLDAAATSPPGRSTGQPGGALEVRREASRPSDGSTALLPARGGRTCASHPGSGGGAHPAGVDIAVPPCQQQEYESAQEDRLHTRACSTRATISVRCAASLPHDPASITGCGGLRRLRRPQSSSALRCAGTERRARERNR